jgi:methylmalonyl-CoA mutase
LKEESYLNNVIDPANGSYYIEHLTNSIAQKSWEMFQEIEKQGGYSATLKNNYLNEAVLKSGDELIANFNSGKTPIIGITKYNASDKTVALIRKDKTEKHPFGKIMLDQ